jgi:bifunctional UDP-N-acetylglucosamine pyrophosphorylase/glucosamine-1-phosphate N-acetyltransferase
VIREPDGTFAKIVEEKDATEAERRVREINSGYYCFRAGPLFEALARIGNDNRQGEYYLTDAPRLIRNAGEVVELHADVPAEQVLGVNTPAQLERADVLLHQRESRKRQSPSSEEPE